MIKPLKAFMAMLLFTLFCSCATLREESQKYSRVNLSAISLGMTKADVQTNLNKRPDNIIVAERDPLTKNINEIVQYSVWDTVTEGSNTHPAIIDTYWLYFVNDKLDHWTQVKPNRRGELVPVGLTESSY